MTAGDPLEPPFGRTLGWVAAGHLAVLAVVVVLALLRPPEPPPLKFIDMVNLGELVKGTPGPSEGLRKAPLETVPPAPQPQAPAPAKAAPEPAAKPALPPPVPAAKTARPAAVPVAKAPAKESPKPAKVKVNLQEVTRPAPAARAPAPAASPAGPAVANPSEVAQRLGEVLKAAGVAKAEARGLSGSRAGTSAEFSGYYRLIKEQMFEAWEPPRNLVGKGLVTQIHILVNADGSIAKAELTRSSGSEEHDATALAAVRKVGKIREPRPEGMPAEVSINFKLDAG